MTKSILKKKGFKLFKKAKNNAQAVKISAKIKHTTMVIDNAVWIKTSGVKIPKFSKGLKGNNARKTFLLLHKIDLPESTSNDRLDQLIFDKIM